MARSRVSILIVYWTLVVFITLICGADVDSELEGQQIGDDHETLATVLDHALEAEFQNDGLTAGKTYNETL